MNEPHIVATESGSFATYTLYSDRVVISHLKEALSIDEQTARVGIEQLETFVGPEPYAVVVDGRDLGYVTPEGRTALRSSVGPHRVATAMVFGSAGGEYVAKRVVAEGGVSAHDAVFSSVEEALQWARSKMAEFDEND